MRMSSHLMNVILAWIPPSTNTLRCPRKTRLGGEKIVASSVLEYAGSLVCMQRKFM